MWVRKGHESAGLKPLLSLFKILIYWFIMEFFAFLKILFMVLFISRERGRKGESEGEKHRCVLATHMPPTRNRTSDPSVHGLVLNPQSHSSHGGIFCFNFDFWSIAFMSLVLLGFWCPLSFVHDVDEAFSSSLQTPYQDLYILSNERVAFLIKNINTSLSF